MGKVLITGATGNVGREVLNALEKVSHQLQIYAGVRDVKEIQGEPLLTNVIPLHFDFTDITSIESALHECEILFLLRPPQLADVEKYFKPIIEICQRHGVKHIIFLSVQGVENSSIIPHFKIEKLIRESKINYTFVRPAYFMQNFTTTLCDDLVNNKAIFLPAGEAEFTLIDVFDVGKVVAKIITEISQHENKSYELTSNERLTFGEMAALLSKGLGTPIKFKSPNLLSFYVKKRAEKTPTMFILVMIMLHYFPRFQEKPSITNTVKEITNDDPISFVQFIQNNKEELTKKRSR